MVVLLANFVELTERICLVLNLVTHFASVVVEHLSVLAEFVLNVLVHLVKVGPCLLGLTVARFLERLAAVEPFGFVADHAVVLVSSVLVHFLVLFSGIVLYVLVVNSRLSVSLNVISLFLLASL